MRYRRVKGATEKFERLRRYIVSGAMERKGNWKGVFGNENPIFLEMGCGKGQFLIRQAQLHPDRNYIGVEGQERVLLRSAQRAYQSGLANVVFVCEFFKHPGAYFAKDEIAGIYLNFSDPWPKARHAKRRLTHGRFLAEYKEFLRPGGQIQFKTDNDPLFDFSLQEFHDFGFSLREPSYDLHASGLRAKDVTTEYEEKFSRWGETIKYAKVQYTGEAEGRTGAEARQEESQD